MPEISYVQKLDTLKSNHSKEYKKYLKVMNNQVLSVEIDALYNVLALGVTSEYELTQRHEANVKRILNLK